MTSERETTARMDTLLLVEEVGEPLSVRFLNSTASRCRPGSHGPPGWYLPCHRPDVELLWNVDVARNGYDS